MSYSKSLPTPISPKLPKILYHIMSISISQICEYILANITHLTSFISLDLSGASRLYAKVVHHRLHKIILYWYHIPTRVISGNFYPEYHFSSRMAPSQLKKPWVMKSDMRGKKFPDITQVMVCNITIISGWLLFPKKLRVNEKVKNQYTTVG